MQINSRHVILLALGAVLTWGFTGCTTVRQESAGFQQKPMVASFYGGKFHRGRTASGEYFNQHGMTAAHKTLPFGTRLRVLYPPNQRSVEVTITDRGPFIRGRDLDLSLGAARKLDIIRHGVVKVMVDWLGRDMRYAKYLKSGRPSGDPQFVNQPPLGDAVGSRVAATPPPAPAKPVVVVPPAPAVAAPAAVVGTGKVVQVASFARLHNATDLRERLEAVYPAVHIQETSSGGKTISRVRIGPVPSTQQALQIRKELESQGFAPIIVP